MINTIRSVHISPFTSGERNDFIYRPQLSQSTTLFFMDTYLPNRYGMQTRIKRGETQTPRFISCFSSFDPVTERLYLPVDNPLSSSEGQLNSTSTIGKQPSMVSCFLARISASLCMGFDTLIGPPN
ncbi:MAG TPA: hypothetical protein VEP90_04715, partial [Methylomirabilota bacterium]|nr:hypothetical protein [Methylomirabilota bacterium]